jgi:hypothetical protein
MIKCEKCKTHTQLLGKTDLMDHKDISISLERNFGVINELEIEIETTRFKRFEEERV